MSTSPIIERDAEEKRVASVTFAPGVDPNISSPQRRCVSHPPRRGGVDQSPSCGARLQSVLEIVGFSFDTPLDENRFDCGAFTFQMAQGDWSEVLQITTTDDVERVPLPAFEWNDAIRADVKASVGMALAALYNVTRKKRIRVIQSDNVNEFQASANALREDGYRLLSHSMSIGNGAVWNVAICILDN